MTCAILEDGGECPLLDGAASREINEGLNNTEIWNGTTDRAKHGVVMAQNEDRMRGIISLPIALAAAICLQPADSVMTVYSFASSGEAQQKHAALFSVDAGPRQEKADVPTQLYQDLKYGVSFQYPSVWTRISKDDQGYFGTKILGSSPKSDIKFRAAVKFSPSGNYYEKTDLEYLSFTLPLRMRLHRRPATRSPRAMWTLEIIRERWTWRELSLRRSREAMPE